MGTAPAAVVGGIVHESSTFATPVTGLVPLAGFTVHAGADLTAGFTGTNTCVGGYLEVCAAEGVEVRPALHARAEPAGTVDPAAYDALETGLLAALDPGCPLILLDLHGAGVIGAGESLELRLLRAVRERAGTAPIVAVTLDLHGNLPPELFALADVVVGFHEYPHIDMAARARRAARIAITAVRSHVRPRSHRLALPMVLPPSPTDSGPGAELRDLARAAEQEPEVLACSVFHGFPYADTAQAATTIVTVTTPAAATVAESVNDRLGDWLWQHRQRFLPQTVTPAQAVAQAPVVIGDAADNPGGGGSGDGTHLLRAVLDSGARACFATLHDPYAVAAAQKAGLGTELDLTLGGRGGPLSGPPIRVRARVGALTDGRVVQRTLRRGRIADFGPCARLAVGALDLVVATHRVQVFDPGIFELHGIDPGDYAVVAVKSASHFRSGFAHLGGRLVSADSPGLTSRDVGSLTPRGPTAGLWPMDAAARRFSLT